MSLGPPPGRTSGSVPSCAPSSRKVHQRFDITGLNLGSIKSSNLRPMIFSRRCPRSLLAPKLASRCRRSLSVSRTGAEGKNTIARNSDSSSLIPCFESQAAGWGTEFVLLKTRSSFARSVQEIGGPENTCQTSCRQKRPRLIVTQQFTIPAWGEDLL